MEIIKYQCRTCKECKPDSEFNKEPRVKSGRTASCTCCTRNHSKLSAQKSRKDPEKRKKILLATRKCCQKHGDKYLELARQYKKKNSIRLHNELRQWKNNNRDKVLLHAKTYAHNKRMRLKGEYARTDSKTLELIIVFWGNKCAYCGGKYEAIDHVVPISKGGKHSSDNLLPACRKCNASKYVRDVEEFGFIPEITEDLGFKAITKIEKING